MTKQEFLSAVLVANEASVEVFKTLVDQIDEPKTVTITRAQLDSIVYEIVKGIGKLGTDLVNSYELSMYGNEVQLEDIEIDESEIESIIESVLETELGINED